MPETSRSDKPRMPSSERQAALTRLAGEDDLLAYLIRKGLPLSWEAYVDLNYFGNEPDELDEVEAEIKELLPAKTADLGEEA